MAYKSGQVFDFRAWIVACCSHYKQRIMRARDGLRGFGTTGKERVRDAGDDKTDRLGAMTFEGARRLVWHVTQFFNHAAHVGQCLGAHAVAAIDDTGNSGGAYTCFSCNLA